MIFEQGLSKTYAALLQIVLLLWLGSWFVEPFASAWYELDTATFYFLNGTLADHPSWAYLIAWVNTPWFDLGVLAWLLLPFLIPNLVYSAKDRGFRFIQLLAILLPIIAFEKIIELAMDFDRLSPTNILTPSILVGEWFPDILTKDESKHSFPGDHAMILLVWALFLMGTSKRWFARVALLTFIVFSTPRLIAGAHWATDILMGSVFFGIAPLIWLVAFNCHKTWGQAWYTFFLRIYHKCWPRTT